MSYQAFDIKVHHPDFSSDEEFEVLNMPVRNGGTLHISPEMQDSFERENGYKLRASLEANGMIEVLKKKEGGDK